MNDYQTCVIRKPSAIMPPSSYVYGVYGVTVHSEILLPLPCHQAAELAHIELRTAPASFFSVAIRNIALEQLSGSWSEFCRLANGSTYVRWKEVGEFLVSRDGRRIDCRQFDEASTESFHVYLLGQALSFALVKCGFEPLHATVVVVEGEAVAFLGESGFGKSSLAACFLDAGFQMLTDDLLLLQTIAGRVVAYPGPPRIKLFPKDAHRLFAEARGVRMNTGTEKLILPLDRKRSCSTPVPLKAVYSLAGPREVFRKQTTRSELLSPREAFLELVKNTFNRRVVDAARLERQLDHNAHLVSLVPIRRLSFSRVWSQLPAVRDAIVADLDRQVLHGTAWID